MTSRDELYLSRKKIYLRVSDVPTLTPVCRKVEIPFELIPLVNSLLFWLTREWAWSGSGSEIDAAVNAVTRLMYDLVDSECETEPTPPQPPPEVIREILSDFSEDFDCEDDDCEDDCMACIKKIRLYQGRLQISYSDNPCDDCWVDIANLTEIITNPEDVGELLLDAAGAAAKIGAKIPFSRPAPRPQERTLAACAKATAIFDAWYEMISAIVGARSTWLDIVNDIPFAKNLIISAMVALLPEPFKSIIKGRLLAEQLAALAGLDLDALEDELGQITRSEVICNLTDYMDAAAEITGDDILALVTTLSVAGFSFTETVHRVFRMFDPLAFAELLSEKYSDFTECGCENITNPPSPDAGESEPHDWCYKFDFTLSEQGFQRLVEGAQSIGEYVQGVGFRSVLTTNADFKRWVGIERTFTGQLVTSISVEITGYSAGVTEVPGNYGRPPRHVQIWLPEDALPMWSVQLSGNKTYTWTGYRQMDKLPVVVQAGIDAVDDRNDPQGSATIKSITIRGLGANPIGEDNC